MKDRVRVYKFYGTKYQRANGDSLKVPEGIVHINGERCVLVRNTHYSSGHGYNDKEQIDTYYKTSNGEQLIVPLESICSSFTEYFEIEF